VRRNVASRALAERTGLVLVGSALGATSGLLDGSHGVLEGTASCEMLSGTNTTLNLLVLELILHAALLAAILLSLLGLSLPVDAGTEDDVLADGGGIECRTGRVTLLETELGPRAALGDLRVDVFANDGGLDASGNLHFLVVIVEAVGDDGLGAIFVGDHLLRGERGGVIEFLVVGPIGTAVNFEENR
jgi:hypothetical protein